MTTVLSEVVRVTAVPSTNGDVLFRFNPKQNAEDIDRIESILQQCGPVMLVAHPKGKPQERIVHLHDGRTPKRFFAYLVKHHADEIRLCVPADMLA